MRRSTIYPDRRGPERRLTKDVELFPTAEEVASLSHEHKQETVHVYVVAFCSKLDTNTSNEQTP